MRKSFSRLFSKKSSRLALIIDLGTTNLKVSLVNDDLEIKVKETRSLHKHISKKSWVTQNPDEMITNVKSLIRKIAKQYPRHTANVQVIGITNQRETTVLWNKKTGKAIYNAIGWEDRRTEKLCAEFRKKISRDDITNRTGLILDPYFSATKIRWILEHCREAKKLLSDNLLAFGTPDSWLVYNLTKEKNHYTDFTNASRTLLFHIKDKVWDQWLMSFFGVFPSMMPAIKKSFDCYGTLEKKIIGREIPIMAILGDQQASLYAAGNKQGTTKITYGTGAFLMQNVGKKFFKSKYFFTTLAAGSKNSINYALEAKIAPCGDLVQKTLGNTKKMTMAMRQIAKNINHYLKHLPFQYKTIYIDGGVARDGIMKQEQQRISKVRIIEQKNFETTTLGTAKLLFDNI